jgi:hypothetical protein
MGRVRVPEVGKNVETCTVMEVYGVRGLAVRGWRQFGKVKRSSVQKARVRRRANRRTGEENNRTNRSKSGVTKGLLRS